jgi:SAM-dependent methyltransferase
MNEQQKNISVQSDPTISYASILKDPGMLAARQSFYQKQLNEIINLFTSGGEGQFLEIGFDDGAMLKAMSEQYPAAKFIGLEVRKSPVDALLAEGYDCRIVKEELFDIAESFDVIYGFAVLHHMENPYKYLLHLYNLLNPGGIIIFLKEAHKWDIMSIMYSLIFGNIMQELNIFKLTKHKLLNYLSDKVNEIYCRYDGNAIMASMNRTNWYYRKLLLHKCPFFNTLSIVIKKY